MNNTPLVWGSGVGVGADDVGGGVDDGDVWPPPDEGVGVSVAADVPESEKPFARTARADDDERDDHEDPPGAEVHAASYLPRLGEAPRAYRVMPRRCAVRRLRRNDRRRRSRRTSIGS
jgi:hypothetical protein